MQIHDIGSDDECLIIMLAVGTARTSSDFMNLSEYKELIRVYRDKKVKVYEKDPWDQR